ncbi:hypothetical protein RND71_031251 [Anisodus tanguticus]|uniref:TSL-kinase interacting protein 1 n=1 Tax=Anisodus tanguticus TaxID=243964 RepID=A0AAE1RAY6_9SOLA|nr:hypothetical protein RND71_031251 [Anisodus tanguticus]
MLSGLLFALLGTFYLRILSVGGLRSIFWCLQLQIECKASTSNDFNMQMERVSLERDTCLHPETFMCKDGVSGVTQHPAAALPLIPSKDHPSSQQSVLTHDHAVTQLLPSSQDQVMLLQPAKKQTRQWAAWTRQEEERFFSALRQVGKNFEKITSRVQSKNKDQVRHYYYRLVRRMNKLLGPELCLDAKNSKDTNAAMLRWWSLLEKYSCKASKLHLKPRRFKIFIETLESQLLKDRKKNGRRRPSQGESSSTAAASLSSHGRVSTTDSRTVKVVLLDNQDVQKFGSGKGSSLKRHVSMGVNRSNAKSDSSPVKNARHRRRIGSASTAAYKRWEKAAIAGVSLVADAAEHLERATIDKDVGLVQNSQGINGFEHVGKDVHSLQTLSQNLLNETNLQSCMKLKLQLFPVDEGTRRALEMDNHNPYLELTLSIRKKMSSVLEHLNRKWGSSSIATGELVLFPYHVQMENLVQSLRLTKDTTQSAADVHNLIGRPPVFRLRYGWFPNAELGTSQEPLSSTTPFTQNTNINITKENNAEILASSHGKLVRFSEEPLVSNPRMTVTSSSIELSGESNLQASMGLNTYTSDHDETLPLYRRENGDAATAEQTEMMPFSCYSFDAAIAAHIYEYQSKADSQMALPPQASSIWNAEDTCDAFAFKKNVAFSDKPQGSSSNAGAENCQRIAQSSSLVLDARIKDLPGNMESFTDEPTHEDPVDECQSDAQALDGSAKDLNGLPEIYWVNLFLLVLLILLNMEVFRIINACLSATSELDAPSCRYHSEDLILGDSIDGLHHLIASSLDAFQNCSFLGLGKEEPGSTVEAVETRTTTFSDLKIGAEV